MKICVLEICPHEPSSNHYEVFGSDQIDYFYVSYKKKSEKAIAFNKNKSWGYNRNCLFEFVKGKYDYYFFIDYDIILESKTDQDPLEVIISQLKTLNPAMYRPSGFRGEMELDSGMSVGGFINHSVTILRNDVANFVFNLPIQFGGFWDAASYINTLLVPVYEDSIYVDYSIIAHNTESSGYIQNKIPFIGLRAMNKLYRITKKYYTSKIPDIAHINDFKEYYNKRTRKFTKEDLNTEKEFLPHEYINIEALKKELNLI